MSDANESVYLRVKNLTKKFGDFVALDSVSLDVHEGEFVCFLGPSGCGKTTLLRAIAGLDIQTSGIVEQAGQDISPLPPSERDFGIVFQSYALFPNLNVIRNISYGLENKKMPRAEIDTRVNELLELVGLVEHRTKYASQLSGGQQQRAAIARALCMEPKALLFDEPTSALDPELEQEVIKVIKDLATEGRTMIIVTHDMRLAADVSDHVVFLHQGKIEEEGPPETMFGAPKTDRLRGFISATQPT